MHALTTDSAKLGHQKPRTSHGQGYFAHDLYKDDDVIGQVDIHLNYLECKIERPKLSRPASSSAGIKQRLMGWSRKSRNYLNRLLKSIVRGDTHPYMLTLTSQEYSEDTQVYHDQVDHFMINFERRFPGCSIIWRLEFQKRGAPHWHLLIWLDELSPPILPQDEEWIAEKWFHIVGGEFSVLEYGTKLTDATDGEYEAKLKNYLLACHHLKADQVRDDIYTGRYWGVRHKEGLNVGPIGHGSLTKRGFFQIRRACRKLKRKKDKALGIIKKNSSFDRHLKCSSMRSFCMYMGLWEIERLFDFFKIQEFEQPCGP